MLLVNASRSSRSSQCTAGSSQCACRWLSRCTKSMATNRSSCDSALSSLAPSGPEATRLPQLIGIGDEATQIADAACQFGAVLPVFKALLENHLDHAEQQRPVLAGPDREMDVGLLGRLGPQWIDHDDGRALLLARQCAAPAGRH